MRKSSKSLRSLKRAEHEHYSRPGVSIDIDVDSHNAKRGSRTRVNPSKSGIRIVHNKLLGGWYVVRGPHQTPLNGRFDSKEEAQAYLNRAHTNPMKGSKHIALQEKRGDSWFTIAWFPHNQKAMAIKIGKQVHRRYPNKSLRLIA